MESLRPRRKRRGVMPVFLLVVAVVHHVEHFVGPHGPDGEASLDDVYRAIYIAGETNSMYTVTANAPLDIWQLLTALYGMARSHDLRMYHGVQLGYLGSA
ncbi:hypothetical protein QC762_0028190 [Podospora pseudocomata]|uniref:Uncharacterized protein n=3 Tax=Podospora TaxID=5144 RepID=A0ABR0HWP1_9PEZI|nr:hypothetical protein QC762_0028190 [Podospora pseudocomata]KAK4672311.1 hypothetical protein QC763_0002580 [Podospora pseudopauciseta]KAK4680803.1 hypothetical protein QC764_0002540 [Podospora pseudoanserina]